VLLWTPREFEPPSQPAPIARRRIAMLKLVDERIDRETCKV
jgi:hypothetical protein